MPTEPGAAGRQLRIGLFLYPTGRHAAGWRQPDAEVGAEDIDLQIRIARTAERGLLDFLFLADTLYVNADGHPSVLTRLEPLTLLSALAVATTRIGLIGTASTTYGEPYHVARQFLSLDHVSKGRAGWNIVTTANVRAARNFGRPSHPEHDHRYHVAREFVDVVRGLWDSFEADALLKEKLTGRYVRAEGVHALNHAGEFYSVEGPINVPRSRQGQPVLAQAGSSEAGRDFAARYAEMVYTAQTTPEEAAGFHRDLKARARALGRDSDHLLVLPGIMPVIGGTEAEARAKLRDMNEGLDADGALEALSISLERDVTGYRLDEPVPAFDTDPADGRRSRAALLVHTARRDRLTFRQLFQSVLGARGHLIVAGTPEQIAGTMAAWFLRGACDGFTVSPPYYPGPFDAFVDEVVPILQGRGLFKRAYAGTNLRESLGLPVPQNRYAR